MAYDTALAETVRHQLAGAGVDAIERAMFGGLAFMVGGHMTVGILGDDLMVRVGPEGYEDALAQPGARPMDFTGRPMTGMVFVASEDLDEDGLAAWIGRGLRFTSSLPPK